MRHKLTDTKLKRLTDPGIYGDGDGLYLRVQAAGGRSWVFIWRRLGTRREIGLGRHGPGAWSVSLAAARRKASECREIIGSGGDPKTDMLERKAAIRTATFGTVADEYVEAMKSKWRGKKTIAAWGRFRTTYAKSIRNVPVDKVSVEDVLRVLRPLWHSMPETASTTRLRIKVVLDHAKARGLREGDNPAEWKGHLDQILPPPDKALRHLAAMPFADVPAFMSRLRADQGLGARALEFAVLTAARSGEARSAVWSEFDLEAAVWTVPAVRMKGKKLHRVPLSGRAVEIVRAMQARQIGDLVFPGARERRPLSDKMLLKVIKRAGGGDVTVHGFRSSFRDWSSEATNFQSAVAEAALAHVVGDRVERSYRRGDVLAKRRELMVAWANYCSGLHGENVIALRSAAE